MGDKLRAGQRRQYRDTHNSYVPHISINSHPIYTHSNTYTGGGGGELLEKAKTNHVLNKTAVSYLHLPRLCFIAYITRPMQPQPESSLIAIVNDVSEDLTM